MSNFEPDRPIDRETHRPWYSVFGGNRGRCPRCGNAWVTYVRRREPDTGCQCCTCCAGLFLWLPLLLIVPFLSRESLVRHCNNCGWEWPA